MILCYRLNTLIFRMSNENKGKKFRWYSQSSGNLHISNMDWLVIHSWMILWIWKLNVQSTMISTNHNRNPNEQLIFILSSRLCQSFLAIHFGKGSLSRQTLQYPFLLLSTHFYKLFFVDPYSSFCSVSFPCSMFTNPRGIKRFGRIYHIFPESSCGHKYIIHCMTIFITWHIMWSQIYHPLHGNIHNMAI